MSGPSTGLRASITSRDLCLWYGDFQALKHVTVDIREGIITGLISQGLVALTSGQMMWLAFAPIQLLIVLVATAAARRGGFASAPGR